MHVSAVLQCQLVVVKLTPPFLFHSSCLFCSPCPVALVHTCMAAKRCQDDCGYVCVEEWENKHLDVVIRQVKHAQCLINQHRLAHFKSCTCVCGCTRARVCGCERCVLIEGANKRYRSNHLILHDLRAYQTTCASSSASTNSPYQLYAHGRCSC